MEAISRNEGVALSVLALAAGAFAVVGASASAPLIKRGLGLTDVGVGAIASISYFGAMLSSRLGGRITDRLGPSIVISVGLLASAVGIALAAIAPDVGLFYAGVLVVGLGYGAVNPATNVLASPSSKRRHGLVLSIKQTGVPLGGIVASATMPVAGSTYGWRWAFAIPVVICLLSATLTQARTRQQPPTIAELGRAREAQVRLRLPHGFGYGFVMAGVQVSIFAFTAVYLVDDRHLKPGWAGLGVSLLLAGGLVGRPIWGWLSDLRPWYRLRFLQAASLVSAALLAAMSSVPDDLLPAALVGVGLSSVAWNGIYLAAVAEAARHGEVGWTTGASLTMINLGAVVCPLLTGLVLQLSHSWLWAWSACSVIALLGSAVIAVSRDGTPAAAHFPPEGALLPSPPRCPKELA